MRAESGYMKFGEDWRGVFIRGDNAYLYALHLAELLRDKEGVARSELSPFNRAVLRGLLRLLEGANEHEHPEGPEDSAVRAQHLKPFAECRR